MPRVPEIVEDNASHRQRQLLDEDAAAYGMVLNTSRIYAHHPEVLPPLRDLHAALLENSTLPEDLVSLVRLHVARISGCPF